MITVRWVPPEGRRIRAIADSLDDGRDPLVVVRSAPMARRVRAELSTAPEDVVTLAEVARDRLDATGWSVPPDVVHGGRAIGAPAPARIRSREWLAAFERAHPEHADRLRLVDRPHDLVATLESLVADGILPGPEGFAAAARRRLVGQRPSLDPRLDAIADRVPTVDRGAVRDAFEAEDAARTSFAGDALTSYLRWCLERDLVTDRQLLAYAARHEASVDRPLVLDAGPRPTAAAVSLGLAGSGPLTVVAGGGAVPDWAWHPTPADVRRHLRGVGGLDADAIAIVDHGGERAAFDTRSGDDPEVTALEWLSEQGAGEGLALVAPTPSTARRLMRLAGHRAMALVREGPVEPLVTEPAVLGLAWLRIATGRQADRGWAVVLEYEGCTAGDIEAWLGTDDKPADLAAFRSDLKRIGDGPGILAAVADRYDLDDRATGALLRTMASDPTGACAPTDAIAAIEEGRRSTRCRRLEPGPPAGVRLVGGADPTAEPPERSVHRLEDPAPRGGPLVYAPPLGLRWRRAIVAHGGHPTPGTAPAWETLGVVRDPPAVRASIAARSTLGWTAERVVIVGADHACSIADRLLARA